LSFCSYVHHSFISLFLLVVVHKISSAFSITSSSACSSKSTVGQLFCCGRNQTGSPRSVQCQVLKGGGQSVFTKINVTQSYDSNETLLLQFNETNSAPDYPLDPPFTMMPSAAPTATVTPMPTATSHVSEIHATPCLMIFSTAFVFMYTLLTT
jgi:hypothetical protein